MYDLKFNDQYAREKRAYIKERPSIGIANRKYSEYEIAGADGIYYENEGTLEDQEIKVTFSFHGEPDEWNAVLRNIKQWLRSDGSMELSMSDDSEIYYKVKKVTFDNSTRTARRIGELEVTFICDGYQYEEKGRYPMTIEDAKSNPGERCKPIYIVTAEGYVKIKVNDRPEFALNVSGTVYVDTTLMSVYKADGTVLNNTAEGDYEELWLDPGENTITVSNASSIQVEPNWRY